VYRSEGDSLDDEDECVWVKESTGSFIGYWIRWGQREVPEMEGGVIDDGTGAVTLGSRRRS
jgi:hypothetical protein